MTLYIERLGHIKRDRERQIEDKRGRGRGNIETVRHRKDKGLPGQREWWLGEPVGDYKEIEEDRWKPNGLGRKVTHIL